MQSDSDAPIDISKPIYRVTFTSADGRLDMRLVNAESEDAAIALVPTGIAAKPFVRSNARYVRADSILQKRVISQTTLRPKPGPRFA